MRSAGWGVALALVALAACAPDPPELMNIKPSGQGPDEFAIMPAKPLELPPSLAALPPPTPGGENRADIRPVDDAVVALGGKPQVRTGSVPAADGGLYAYSARYGTSPDIRQVLAAEDLQWRRDNNGRLLERWFNVTVYFRAYEDQSLDQEAELARWRRAMVPTPSAPPPPLPD